MPDALDAARLISPRRFCSSATRCSSALAARIPSDCWDGLSYSISDVARGLSLSARARTSADVNVMGSRLPSMLIHPISQC
jgi:hypothetical protein